MGNRRKTDRKRVLKTATIELNGGSIDCVIRNLSEAGAALEVATPLGIPPHFSLLFAADHTRRACTVIWRKETRIGVSFQ